MAANTDSQLQQSANDSCSLLVSLPLLISYGAVVKQDSSTSASYVFPSQFPSAKALLARSQDSCDMFVGQLQVDLVSFCCKRSQVAQVASTFTRLSRKKLNSQFDSPIYVRCTGLQQKSSNSVGQASGGLGQYDAFTGSNQQRVYYTAVDVVTEEDKHKFWTVEDFVDSYVEKLKELRIVNLKTITRTQDLFVVVRRFLNDPPPHPVTFYSKFVCEGIQLSEIRLVFSKGTSQCPVKHLKIDPRFPTNEISCRPIVCDIEGKPARQQFCFPKTPQVFSSLSAALSYFETDENSFDSSDSDSEQFKGKTWIPDNEYQSTCEDHSWRS